MRFCLFILFADTSISSPLDPHDRAALMELLADLPGLHQVLLHEPARASDPYVDDGAPPRLVLQLYADELPLLERVMSATSPLQEALRTDRFPPLAATGVCHQVMLIRRFPVWDVTPDAAADASCTYLVAYEGEADDPNDWLSHYLDTHPRLMARLPGIREIEIYTRVDWCSGLPILRANCLQRNKVVFDSPTALAAALNSPVRQEMRAHFLTFPPFSGRVTHYPLATSRVGDLRPPARSDGSRGS